MMAFGMSELLQCGPHADTVSIAGRLTPAARPRHHSLLGRFDLLDQVAASTVWELAGASRLTSTRSCPGPVERLNGRVPDGTAQRTSQRGGTGVGCLQPTTFSQSVNASSHVPEDS